MAGTFLFELVSPEKLLLSEQVNEVVLPASEGYMTVMANHAPMVINIIPGVVTVKTANSERSFVVYGGFVDISQNGCSLLAEFAKDAQYFDQNDLEQRIEDARQKLHNADNNDDRNAIEDFLHQLTTVRGVLTMA